MLAIALLGSIPATAVMFPLMRALARVWKLERPNFRGDLIPAGFGFLLVLCAVPVYAGMAWAGSDSDGRNITFLAAVLVFGITGLLDDMYGTRAVGGFRGHFSLLAQGKLSTGVLKAGLGGLCALALGGIAAGFNPVMTVVNGVVIALAANALNLLDLRPGRAVSCFWAGVILLVLGRLGSLSVWPELIVVIPSALLLTCLDRSARVMLGDAGSNALGAVLGLALAWEIGTPAKLAVIVLLGALNVYSEKRSISKLIEGNRILRGIDCRLGER